jgi:hypothetical protein
MAVYSIGIVACFYLIIVINSQSLFGQVDAIQRRLFTPSGGVVPGVTAAG